MAQLAILSDFSMWHFTGRFGIGVCSLSSHGQSFDVSNASIAFDRFQTFDIIPNVLNELLLRQQTAFCDRFVQSFDSGFVQMMHPNGGKDSVLMTKSIRGFESDSFDFRQNVTDHEMTSSALREVHDGVLCRMTQRHKMEYDDDWETKAENGNLETLECKGTEVVPSTTEASEPRPLGSNRISSFDDIVGDSRPKIPSTISEIS